MKLGIGSLTCPNCLSVTGKKELSERVHKRGERGYETDTELHLSK